MRNSINALLHYSNVRSVQSARTVHRLPHLPFSLLQSDRFFLWLFPLLQLLSLTTRTPFDQQGEDVTMTQPRWAGCGGYKDNEISKNRNNLPKPSFRFEVAGDCSSQRRQGGPLSLCSDGSRLCHLPIGSSALGGLSSGVPSTG
ncbi:hypothetical protein CRG98_004492 [Punica granatum]|uniref:Uncharacterized protein n=1 Tax=Punica granatum TaxID=22663 RepID=A0A2I0L376_PUNGR|nr:hypothetical protein CRG98_004492 [Punica granatum]